MKTPAAKGLSTDTPAQDEHDYEANNFHDTLMRAEEIKADPAKMERVRKIAGAKMAAAQSINSIADIKVAAKRVRKQNQAAATAASLEKAKAKFGAR